MEKFLNGVFTAVEIITVCTISYIIMISMEKLKY